MSDPLYALALRLLARREYTAWQLRQRLQTRSTDQAAVEAVLRRLAAQGLQSDVRYVEISVRLQIERGYGPLRIQAYLQDKGLDPELIAEGLQPYAAEWPVQVQRVWHRRYKTPPTDPIVRQRQARFLQTRGFTYGQINSLWNVLDKLSIKE